MKIGPDIEPRSAISTSNPDAILVRGLDLETELMGRVSFTDHVWLLITGALPSPAQGRMLDATLVAIAEHGLVPSVAASRMTYAAAPEAFQGAVAAGLLGCGSVILGAAEAAGRFLDETRAKLDAGQDDEAAIRQVVGGYRAMKRAIPGYGHPLHKDGDPRAKRLLALAAELGLAGDHCRLAVATEALLPELTGRPLQMNVSGAIPAVLLDAGYPLKALKGVPLLARTGSLIAHLLEEQSRPIGFAMAHAASEIVAYDGPLPDGFTPGEG
jgi:citrate synthase